MKRFLVLLLAVILVFGALGSLAEEEANAATAAKLSDMVREFLEHYKYKYTYNDSNNSYRLEFELDGVLQSCVIKIYVYYDAIEIFTIPDLTVPEENLEKLAVAAALLNDKIFYSQFGISFKNNFIYARSVQLVKRTLPGFEELDVIFHQPMFDLERYGDALYAVSQEGANPHEEFEKIK
ncbi:MAG: hypothetical protein QM308_01485 [Bacillota bacterium]|nr:hypothetical protein [Bacillota bacterium]